MKGNVFQTYHVRNQHLRRQGYESYADYLKTPEWKAIRLRVLQRSAFKCARCGKRAWCVHHALYNPGSMNGRNVAALVPLCQPCHDYGEMDGDRKCSLEETNARLGLLMDRPCRECRRTRPWHTFAYYGDTVCRSCTGWDEAAKAQRPSRPPRKGKNSGLTLIGGPHDGEKYRPDQGVKGRAQFITIKGRDGSTCAYEYAAHARAYKFLSYRPPA